MEEGKILKSLVLQTMHVMKVVMMKCDIVWFWPDVTICPVYFCSRDL